jgi:hypothetical protein
MTVQPYIISCNEPQLERCITSVRRQSVPFTNIIHINDIVPESVAYNKARKLWVGEWTLGIGGDFILYKDAHAQILDLLGDLEAGLFKNRFYSDLSYNKIGQIEFGLEDSFLQTVICCCILRRSTLFSRFKYTDGVFNDREAADYCEKQGYTRLKLWKDESFVLGTHFDEPTIDQVFIRFYIRGSKFGSKNQSFGKSRLLTYLRALHTQTKDVRYTEAIRAVNIGFDERDYTYSHNHKKDQEILEKWAR